MGNLTSGMCYSKNRIDGKTVVITGANTGIGKVTASFLCERGGHVIVACRNKSKGLQAANEIRDNLRNVPGAGDIVVKKLDLSSLKSVRECASEILNTEMNIDILINNAAVMVCPFELTEDGYELQFATNHLGHYLFTLLLLPRILSSAPARIVNVSSVAHTLCKSMEFENINMINNYSPVRAYERSKAANILFTVELANRLKGSGVNVYSLHPGVINTSLFRHTGATICPCMPSFMGSVASFFIKSPWQGAQTTIHCAICEETESDTGLYYSDCKPIPATKFSSDPEMAKLLFEESAKYVNLDFTRFDPFTPDSRNIYKQRTASSGSGGLLTTVV